MNHFLDRFRVPLVVLLLAHTLLGVLCTLPLWRVTEAAQDHQLLADGALMLLLGFGLLLSERHLRGARSRNR